MFNLGTLGGLFVSLGVDTAQFEGDMGKAASAAERQSQRINSAVGSIGATAAATATAAAGALAILIKNTIDAGDELSKLSTRTGFSVENLSELKFAAAQADVSVGQLSTSLGFFNKTLADAADPNSREAQLFKSLGVDISQGAQPAFDQFMRSINELPNHEQKVAAMRMAFGKAGDALLQMAEDLDKTREKARAMGIVISEDLAKKSEKAKDDLNAVATSINTIGIAAAGPVVEYLGNVAAALAKASEQGGIFNATVREGFKLMGALASQIPAFWWMEGPLQKEFDKDALGIGRSVSGKIKAAPGTPDVNAEMTACVVSGGKWVNGKCIRGKSKKGRDDSGFIGRQLTEGMEEENRVMSEASHWADEYNKKMRERTYWENMFGEERVAGMTVDQIREMHRLMLEGIDIDRAREEAMMRAYAGFDENGKRIVEDLKSQKSLAKDLGLTFQSAFEDAAISGKKFSDVLKGLAQDLARLALRKTLTEPLGNAASSWIDEAMKGVFNMSGGGGGDDVFGGYTLEEMGIVGAYATGTDYVPRTGLAMVHQGEAIIPASENRGGGAPVVNVHFQANTPAAVRDAVFSMVPAIKEAVSAGIRNDNRRGR